MLPNGPKRRYALKQLLREYRADPGQIQHQEQIEFPVPLVEREGCNQSVG